MSFKSFHLSEAFYCFLKHACHSKLRFPLCECILLWRSRLLKTQACMFARAWVFVLVAPQCFFPRPITVYQRQYWCVLIVERTWSWSLRIPAGRISKAIGFSGASIWTGPPLYEGTRAAIQRCLKERPVLLQNKNSRDGNECFMITALSRSIDDGDTIIPFKGCGTALRGLIVLI